MHETAFAEMAFSIVAPCGLESSYSIQASSHDENLKQVFTPQAQAIGICISVRLVVAGGLCPDLNPTVAARARQRVKRVFREAKGLNRNAALIGVDIQEPLLDVGDCSERIPRKV